MLNKHSKVVLKQLIKTNFQFTDINSFAAQFPKMTVHQVESTLSYLHENGYIACLFADDTIYRLTPTYKGENYSQFNRVEIKRFVFNSFIIPLLVSIIANIVLAIID